MTREGLLTKANIRRACDRRVVGDDAGLVSVPEGRWGRRRVRVDECAGELAAETVYASARRQLGARLAPGYTGTFTTTIAGVRFAVGLVVRPNALWAGGRLFLLCPECGGRCGRLYVPTVESGLLACRRCLGLTYESRAMRRANSGRQ